MRNSSVAVWLTVWMIAQAGTTCAAADDTEGLAKERPSQGRCVATAHGFMIPYTARIPGTEATFEMVPIPGGTYLLGSPRKERGRAAAEGPQVKVTLAPFWMGKHEVTWAEYRLYMELYTAFREFETQGLRKVTEENRADAVTAPTELYDPSFPFQSGADPRLPAVTMTQFAAKQYTCWLSKMTAQQYRLPTEAEWEYACRAGSTTAYHFGDSWRELTKYAWYFGNSNERSHPVGLKAANAWGLHDMHGNVWEWVVDQYSADTYRQLHPKQQDLLSAVRWPTRATSLSVRGGSWDDFAKDCRAATRLMSDDDRWKAEDANLPASPWWFTSSPSDAVGFRLVRSLEPLPISEITRFWNSTVPQLTEDVEMRVQEARGSLGLVDENLPQALQQLEQDP